MKATLDIDPQVLQAAEEEARRSGRTVDQVIEDVLRRELVEEPPQDHSRSGAAVQPPWPVAGSRHPAEGTPDGPPPLPPEFYEKVRLLAYPEFTPPEWDEILRQRAEWFEKHGNAEVTSTTGDEHLATA